MTNLNSIQLHIQTAGASDASTDGDVYLGIAGREFFVDSSIDDFQQGDGRTYVFGSSANVLNAADNDPRRPQLQVEDIDRHPVYLRFVPTGSTDKWKLQRADVSINGRILPIYDTASFIPNSPSGGIYLARRAGLTLHLRRHDP